MLRLIKYLKPYLLLIILAIVLLFVQANADLALPDYLSRIVNNGIQQGGVENAVPEAIRQSQMDKLDLFMSSEEAGTGAGRLHPGGADVAPSRASTSSEYPALADEPVYVLQRSGPG